jgi:putative ABC transport system permease protein
MGSLLQDIRHSVRNLSRQPGFALVAIVSLAVGIGVNTAIFSVFDRLLFRPPALRNLDRSVVVYHRSPGSEEQGTSYRASAQYRERRDVFARGMTVTGARSLLLTEGERRDPVQAEPVSSGFFSIAAIRLRLGAPFPVDVDQPSGPPVIILSHAFWTRRFNADPSVVGASITLNGEPFTVTGVADQGFTGLFSETPADMWIPITTWMRLAGQTGRLTSDEQWVTTVAELAPGVSLEQAQAAMKIAGQSLALPDGREAGVRAAADGLAAIPTDAYFIVGGVFAIGLIVLALACTNVANLLMARAAARQHEMAVRLALGSGRVRLLWLWISESLVLSASAAALGLIMSAWLLSAFSAFRLPAEIGEGEGPLFLFDFHLDLRVFAFALALGSLTALVVGLVSGLQSSRGVVMTRMNSGRGSGRRFAPGLNVRSAVIALQMALSTILLIPCGLFVRSALATVNPNPGFEATGVLLLPISANQSGVKVQRPDGFESDLAGRVRRLPGVVSATVMDPVPLFFGGRFAQYRTEGHGAERMGHASVGLQYFATMRIPLIAGRDFEPTDTTTAPAVAIVNETMARRFWPNGSAVGQRLHDFDEPMVVIGVARDAKYRSLSEAAQPWVYRPITQLPSTNVTLSLAVRTTGDPTAFQAAVKREVQALVPNWPGFQFRTLDEGLLVQRAVPRMAATLLGSLGLFGLFLAMLGIYGVMAYVVRQRRLELGIRLALGAPAARVIALVVKQGMLLCAAGTVAGIGVALGVAKLASSALSGVGGADLLTCIVVPLVLMTIALVACYLPAREVTRIDRSIHLSISRPM